MQKFYHNGKISAQPHTTLCIQFLDRENNDKNNRLPLGKQICFLYGRTVERSYNQIFLAKWVTTILYSYGATLCELRYKDKRWWRFRRKATLFLEKREQPLFYPGAAGGICCIKIIFSWSFPHHLPPPALSDILMTLLLLSHYWQSISYGSPPYSVGDNWSWSLLGFHNVQVIHQCG